MGFIAALLGGQSNFKAQGVNQDNVNWGLNQAGQGINQQQNFVNALQPGGTQALAAQQQLLQQLQQQTQGGGPNPAQLQLNNTTGQNIAQQAALQASQRGVSQNAGMIARQTAQQGGQLQQQEAGQAALMRAQQQLAAQQALGQQAAQSVGQQQQGLSGLNAAQQGFSGQVLNANAQQNSTNAGTANQNAANVMPLVSGGLNALGKGVSMLAEGGEVQPASIAGQFLRQSASYKDGGKVGGKAQVPGDSSKNDKVPAMLSPGEIVVPRSHSGDPKKAAAFAAAVARRSGKGKK